MDNGQNYDEAGATDTHDEPSFDLSGSLLDPPSLWNTVDDIPPRELPQSLLEPMSDLEIAEPITTRLTTAMSTPRSSPSPLPLTSSAIRPLQQRRTASASHVPALSSVEQLSSPITFDPPLRSLFSTGLPTSSVSANTAQASLSSALPTSRPLAALSGVTTSRRLVPRAIDIPLPVSVLPDSRQSFLIPEKDIDDPSNSMIDPNSEPSLMNKSATLSRLFVASDGHTPGALSRGVSHLRTWSGAARSMNETATLPGHLLHRGFIDGRHSDITVHAFGHSYRLHKLLLDRVPFFSSAFSGVWAESSASDMRLHPEETDSHITRSAFELALRRIYGSQQPQQEDQEAIGLFATACWLDMADLVESSVDSLLRQMHPSKLHVLIKLVTNNYYGKAGDRILSSAKAMLCREGWEMPYEYWDQVPAEIIREIIGGDPFYVPGEWERWFLALKLLNRRLRAKALEAGLVSSRGTFLQPRPTTIKFYAIRFDTTYRRDAGVGGGRNMAEKDDTWISLYTAPEIAPLLVLLDEGIHYVHLRFEQLQQIRTQRDVLGVPVLPEKIISDALWQSMELRQRVVNAMEGDLELGLSEIAEEYLDELEAQDPAQPLSTKGKQREGIVEESNDMESGSWDGNGKPRKFWIPSNDISCVMGGSREAFLAGNSIGQPDWTTHTSRLSANLEPSDVTWAADFTGALPDISGPSPRIVSSQLAPRYSHYPPFRFSAEFPNPRTLKEKKRVYSQTVWYAGSMWNLYIQRVNTTKNQQLGIYLHRAKDKDPSDDPLAQFIPSSVDDRIGQLEREMLMRKSERRNRHWRSDVIASGAEADREDESSGSSPDFDGTDGSINRPVSLPSVLRKGDGNASRLQKISQTPDVPPSKTAASSMFNQLLDSDEENEELVRAHRRYNVSAIPPYVDGRPTIKTYFKIYSPSKAGRLLSIYESAPDRFNFSQSWGWKSSQMVLDDGMSGYDVTKGAKEGKLRYMVVIGNV